MTPMSTTTSKAKSTNIRAILTAGLLCATLTLHTSAAGAVSLAVKMACMSDYLSNCSAYSIGSQELRQCMRAVGPRLSKGCIGALVAAGEVSQAEVNRRRTAGTATAAVN